MSVKAVRVGILLVHIDAEPALERSRVIQKPPAGSLTMPCRIDEQHLHLGARQAHETQELAGWRLCHPHFKSEKRLVALEKGSDLIGVARLYAISFDRQEVGSSWALSSEETQAGAVWWRCREVGPKQLLP